ncbi:EthD family reductase [Gordonia insulae]|uniref:EthD domain-containing protein n=1 Tax=Gordonia insulae TaxID=2420509 RepID=A0A3G8JQM4_9ACTN|nr:EthD family reductase [Gordonia insulae]AZG46809.1 hypothetical protein D7316_03414 [Gordonia insulae]
MYHVTITYGHPEDPQAFDEYYSTTHLPLAAKIPGVRAFSAGRTETLDGTAPSVYYLASITFDDKESAAAGFTSPEGQAAAADIPNFATGGATLHFNPAEISIP